MRTAILSLALTMAASAIASEAPIIAALPGQADASAEDSLGDYTASLEDASAGTPQGVPSAPVPQASPKAESVATPAPIPTPGGAPPYVSGAGAPPIVAPPPAPVTVPSAPVPAADDDSLDAAYGQDATPHTAGLAPTPKEPTVARGLSLLPARPEAGEMRFSGVSAAEVALRFAREYRVSIVLSGDGSTPITGWTTQTGDIEGMLRSVFQAPEWGVTRQGTTFIVSARTALSFRRISLAELNPSLDATK